MKGNMWLDFKEYFDSWVQPVPYNNNKTAWHSKRIFKFILNKGHGYFWEVLFFSMKHDLNIILELKRYSNIIF